MGAVGIVEELRRLRRGAGVHAPDLEERLGPVMLRVCGVEASDSSQDVRRKVTARLAVAARGLPPSSRLAAEAALATDPECQFRFLKDRMGWLAMRLDRDPRTATRRADDGLRLLGEQLLLTRSENTHDEGSDFAPEGWFINTLGSVLILSDGAVTLMETRRMTATDDLTEVTVSWSVPRPPGERVAPVEVDLLYGGQLVRNDDLSTAGLWSGRIRLAKPLVAGDEHEYSVRISTDRWVRPYYIVTPLRRTDEFDVRVKFSAGVPARVWRVEGVPSRFVDENTGHGDILTPDEVGEVAVSFPGLRRGLSYGVRWARDEDSAMGAA